MSGACFLPGDLDYSRYSDDALWDAFVLWQGEDFTQKFALSKDAQLRHHKMAAIREELVRRGIVPPKEISHDLPSDHLRSDPPDDGGISSV